MVSSEMMTFKCMITLRTTGDREAGSLKKVCNGRL